VLICRCWQVSRRVALTVAALRSEPTLLDLNADFFRRERRNKALRLRTCLNSAELLHT